ncbi:MAG: helix-turn-helix domain-containing protein [Gemmatimonadota bacterium]
MPIRLKLLDAAARVYAETGFRGATTRRIAREAGVNEITLFRHFGSKARLLHEAIACAAVASPAALLPVRPVHPRLELLEWSRSHLKDLYEKRALIRTCMGEVEEHPDMIAAEGNPTSSSAKDLGRYLRRLKAAGLAKAPFDPASAAAMLMGVLFADAMGRDVIPDMFNQDMDTAVHHYIDLFLRGIGVTAARSSVRRTPTRGSAAARRR